jgi:hypothetical protein
LLQKIVAGSLIDSAFGELGQHVVRVTLLIEGLLKNAYRVVVAERFGVAARGAVGGDFEVLDALRGGDQRRIERLAALRVVETPPSVLDRAAIALLGTPRGGSFSCSSSSCRRSIWIFVSA